MDHAVLICIQINVPRNNSSQNGEGFSCCYIKWVYWYKFCMQWYEMALFVREAMLWLNTFTYLKEWKGTNLFSSIPCYRLTKISENAISESYESDTVHSVQSICFIQNKLNHTIYKYVYCIRYLYLQMWSCLSPFLCFHTSMDGLSLTEEQNSSDWALLVLQLLWFQQWLMKASFNWFLYFY